MIRTQNPIEKTSSQQVFIGLTGGIGSGKTMVSDYLHEHFHIDVVDADMASRIVVQKGSIGLQSIADRHGPEILQEDGSLNRAELRKIIFSDTEEKQWLEKLLHPLINQTINDQLQAAQSSYVIVASPLLFEANQQRYTNAVIVVDAPESLQLERASSRDTNSKEQIQAIMDSQMQRDTRLSKAHWVVENNADFRHLQTEIETVHQAILKHFNLSL